MHVRIIFTIRLQGHRAQPEFHAFTDTAVLQAVQSTFLEDAFALVSPGALYVRFFRKEPPAPPPEDKSDLEYYL